MPPVPIGKVYQNYTATLEEAVEVAFRASLNVELVVSRSQVIINSRIAIIATATGLNASAFGGSLARVVSRRRELMVGWRRRLNAIDTSACNGTGEVYVLTIVHETSDPSERDMVTNYIQGNSDALGMIIDATGEGDDATVCVPVSVTSLDREVVDAPPPPPLILAQETPPAVPPSTIIIVATIVTGLVCLCCGLWLAYFVTRRRADDDDDAEEKRLLKARKAAVKVASTDMGWKPLRM